MSNEVGLRQVHKQEMKYTWYVVVGDSVTEKGGGTDRYVSTENLLNVGEDSVLTVLDSSTSYHVVPSKDEDKKLDTVEVYRANKYMIRPDGEFVDVEFMDGKDSATVAYLRNYFEQGWPVFPTGEISVGHTWTHSTAVRMPDETINASTDFKLTNLVRESGYDCAVIEYNGNMILPVDVREKKDFHETGVDRIELQGLMYFAYKEGVVVLVRDHWSLEADRNKTNEKTGEESSHKIYRETDVEYWLIDVTWP